MERQGGNKEDRRSAWRRPPPAPAHRPAQLSAVGYRPESAILPCYALCIIGERAATRRLCCYPLPGIRESPLRRLHALGTGDEVANVRYFPGWRSSATPSRSVHPPAGFATLH